MLLIIYLLIEKASLYKELNELPLSTKGAIEYFDVKDLISKENNVKITENVLIVLMTITLMNYLAKVA